MVSAEFVSLHQMFGKEYIEVSPIGLTRGISLQKVLILLLREVGGERCLPVLLSESEYRIIHTILVQHRTLRADLAHQLTEAFFIRIHHVEIDVSPRGKHSSFIYYSSEDALRRIEVDLPTAISVVVREKCSLRIPEALLKTHAQQPEGGMMSFMLSEMTDGLLEEARRAAVEEEKYEFARLIQNEIQRRSLPEAPEADNPLPNPAE